jgi:PAS domain-containing protein
MVEKPGYEKLEKRIQELGQVQQALQETEPLFLQMFYRSTTSMCLYNPEGIIIKANSEFCKMFGVEEKTIISAGYNVFKDQAAIDAGIIPFLRDIFDRKKTRSWEIAFNIDSASKSTKTPTSKAGTIFLKASQSISRSLKEN